MTHPSRRTDSRTLRSCKDRCNNPYCLYKTHQSQHMDSHTIRRCIPPCNNRYWQSTFHPAMHIRDPRRLCICHSYTFRRNNQPCSCTARRSRNNTIDRYIAQYSLHTHNTRHSWNNSRVMNGKTKVGSDNHSRADNRRDNPQTFRENPHACPHRLLRVVPTRTENNPEMLRGRNIDHTANTTDPQRHRNCRARGHRGSLPRQTRTPRQTQLEIFAARKANDWRKSTT